MKNRPDPLLTTRLELYKKEVLDTFAPKFEIKWKQDFWLMHVIKHILFFNPGFMTNYITVIIDKVYVPDDWNSYLESSQLSVIAHEGVHMYDTSKNPLMGVLYLMPALLFPIIAIGLAFVSPWFLLLALLGALPWPSPFRFYYELRGYRMNLLLLRLSGEAKGSPYWNANVEDIVAQLSGPGYYFTWPFKSHIRKYLEAEGWESEEIYQKTVRFIKTHS